MTDRELKIIALMMFLFVVFGIPSISMMLALHYHSAYWLLLCMVPISIFVLAPTGVRR